MNRILAKFRPAQARAVMIQPICNWSLARLHGGKVVESMPLTEGSNTIGRDNTNRIVLSDSSVSRCHAEIICGSGDVSVRDLKSRNGIRVNGVPRQEASLQPSDRIEIGIYCFELKPSEAGETALLSLHEVLANTTELKQTLDDSIRLPESARERHLATLYHVCFWIAEGVEENAFVPRCLRLLSESLRAQEAHLYASNRQLEAWVTERRTKPSIKLADFLAKKFQETKEATVVLGKDISQHQQRINQFNYLISPLRTARTGSNIEVPFVLLIRPTEWKDFTADDRVLLQAICQLWARGLVKAQQVRELREENSQLRRKVTLPRLLGSSAVMERLRTQAAKAAALQVTILLQGETGSGKEVVAEFIHENSSRRTGPFVKVNCAAIPDTLIESELFGHVKGAFTGAATDRRGKFAQADGGTLFLDEIGEMPLETQAKVLRAIENREVEAVGAESATQIDVRIIAATNRDLKAMISAGQFRQDLYYRLNVINITVPALREHPDDIEELVTFFLEKFCSENGLTAMSFSPAAFDALKKCDWPGNVRELRNIAQRCAVNSASPVIGPEEIAKQMLETPAWA